MSWQHSKYQARCENCGEEGFCIKSSDDWNRSKTPWEGFENKRPNPILVDRGRVGVDDYDPVCSCGNTKVVKGERLDDF